jgi:hypothetical protein
VLRINLSLAIESVEQSGTDLLGRNGQVVEPVIALSRQRRRARR